eukprot:scaffold19846_cov76-Skeletonema_marinoi.AAC.1
MSDMNQLNSTADSAAAYPSASPSDNNSSVNNDNNAASSNNLDVLLLAAAMVTSPSKANANKKKPAAINNDAAAASADGAHHVSSGMMPTTQQQDPSTLSNAAQPSSLINNNTFMTKCWPTSSRIASDIFHATSSASSTPTVTPPFTIELVDDIPFAALPTIQNSTAPPRMKTQGSGCASGGKRGCMNPFALPIKKRYTAAAKKNMMSEGDDGQQPCGEMKESVDAMSSTIDIARQDSSSSSTTTTTAKKKKYRKPQCSHPSCPNRVMNQGVCARHGAR